MTSFYNNDNLHAACSAGSTQRVQHLIDSGADVDEILGDVETVDRDGKSPAFYAARYNNPGCLGELREGGASMDHEIYDPIEDRSTTPVHEAGGYGHALCLEAICSNQENSDVINCTADGETPMHRAALEGHVAAVNACIKLGANVDGGYDSNHPSSTPAHLAASRGHETIIRVLGSAGARFRIPNEHKQDVYEVAIAHGHEWLFDAMKLHEYEQADSASAGDGSGSVTSSYLGGAKRAAQDKEQPHFLSDGAKMPESFKEYKWPWDRNQGY